MKAGQVRNRRFRAHRVDMMMSMMMIRIGQNISEKTLYFNGGTREFDRLICKPDRRSVPYI